MNKIKFGTTVEVATPDRIKELRSKNPESIGVPVRRSII